MMGVNVTKFENKKVGKLMNAFKKTSGCELDRRIGTDGQYWIDELGAAWIRVDEYKFAEVSWSDDDLLRALVQEKLATLC